MLTYCLLRHLNLCGQFSSSAQFAVQLRSPSHIMPSVLTYFASIGRGRNFGKRGGLGDGRFLEGIRRTA